MAVIIRDFRQIKKNSLRGFATIELPIGLVIKDVTINNTQGRVWAGLPSKPQMENGAHKADPKTRKPAYAKILEWRSRDLSDGFSDAVIAAMRDRYPDALI